MNIKTNVRAGGLKTNHNQITGLAIKTSVKAGVTMYTSRPKHNQTAMAI